MSRPLIWLKRIGWALISLSILAVLAFVSVNITGYLRFQRAWHIGDRLSPDDLRQMAAACTDAEKGGHRRLSASEIPAPFRKLNALSATFYPGSSDLLLFEVGEVGVWMRISTSKQDQEIIVFTNFIVPQGTSVLWHKNAEYERRRNPTDRLVTISEYHMHGGREWIVLPQEIRVIDRDNSVGADDPIAAVVPLSESNRRKITEAMAGIPASVRGHEYTSGAADGLGLHFAFAADGRRQRDDIRLSNTWRDELSPLIDAVSICVSAKDAIGFKASITQNRFYDPKQQSSFTWAELDAREKRWMPLPWWCVWPRLLVG